MPSHYILLLNEVLKTHILASKTEEKRRLVEKLEFLANGIWDAGVRVKKLKGVSRKVIFEARLSRAERILFTLGRYDGSVAVYVWGIASHDEVSRIARAVMPQNAPFLHFEPETMREETELLLDDLPEEAFSQENIEQKAGEEYGPQRWLVLDEEQWRRLLAEAEPDSLDIHLFLTAEQRSVLNTDPPLLLSGTAGSGKTTILVYYLLRREFLKQRRLFLTYNPLLKRFSERLYRGLIKNTELEPEVGQDSGRGGGAGSFPKAGRKQAEQKPAAEQEQPGVAPAATHPEFLVFRDLLEAILESGGFHHDRETEADLETFDRIFRNHGLYRRYDSELVWEEIRSIIKGAKPPLSAEEYRRLASGYLKGSLGRKEVRRLQDYLIGLKPFELFDKIEQLMERKARFPSYEQFVQALEDPKPVLREQIFFLLQGIMKILERKARGFDTPLLSLEEYRRLGKKRAPNFLYNREEIYSIAQYYQERLEAEGLLDEIDLCRRALNILNRDLQTAERFSYDLVVCDEVQDFADIQLALVLRLARSVSAVALAGDPRQIINPSGFRWEDAKQKFFERGLKVPEVHTLRLNFRCVGSVVKLANALLALKQRLVGLSGAEPREDWKFQGKPPFLITGLSEREVSRHARPGGAGRIVLVRTPREQDRLKQLLNTELIFTIYEAKGLEFDAVLLWKYCQDPKAADIWRRIRQGQSFDETHAPHIRHEVNLLYVAVTRARNTLIVYDGAKPAEVWEVEELQGLVHRSGEQEVLAGMWERVSTPEEWAEQGDYFFQRSFFEAAAECYRNAGQRSKMELAEAFGCRKKGLWAQAAEVLARHRYHREAAECYEKGGGLEQAVRHWQEAGEPERSRVCSIRLLEEQGQFARAAEEWERLGNTASALANWEKARNYGRLADHHFNQKEFLQAARMYENDRNWASAGESYRKAGEPKKAAELLLKAGELEAAAELYRKLKDHERLLHCYERMGDHYAAARLREKRKELPQAIERFRLFAESAQANRARLLEEAQMYQQGRGALKAALRYSALSHFDKSAPLFLARKHYTQARADFLAAGEPLQAAECLARMGDHLEAAREMERLDFPGRRERVVKKLEKHLRPHWFMIPDRAEALAEEARDLLERGEPERALFRFEALGSDDGVHLAYVELGRDEEALRYFLDRGMLEWAEDYVDERAERLEVSEPLLAYLTQRAEAAGSWYVSASGEAQLALALFALRSPEVREKTLPLLKRFLSCLGSFYYFEQDPPREILDLFLEARHYNALANLAGSYEYRTDRLPEAVDLLFQRVRRSAEQDGDRALLACALLLSDESGYESLLDSVPVSPENYRLFVRSPRHYLKAVHFLLSSQELSAREAEEAATICRMQNDWGLAGFVEERRGELKKAGKNYLQAGRYEEALRCYRRAGDEVGEARVWERRGGMKKAVEIWKRLGRKRDVQRLREKQRRGEQKASQLDLF